MQKNWVFLIALIFIPVGFMSGCTQQEQSQVKENTITINNFVFNPSTLTVKAGTNVTWTNEDSVTHQIREDKGLFESSTLAQGQSFTYTFGTAGTYNYTCTIHSSMHGKVIVE